METDEAALGVLAGVAAAGGNVKLDPAGVVFGGGDDGRGDTLGGGGGNTFTLDDDGGKSDVADSPPLAIDGAVIFAMGGGSFFPEVVDPTLAADDCFEPMNFPSPPIMAAPSLLAAVDVALAAAFAGLVVATAVDGCCVVGAENMAVVELPLADGVEEGATRTGAGAIVAAACGMAIDCRRSGFADATRSRLSLIRILLTTTSRRVPGPSTHSNDDRTLMKYCTSANTLFLPVLV